jgi:hypothetical protein
MALSFSASRKCSRSAAEEDGQAAKRKETDRDAPDVQTRCVAIHSAIKAMPDNLDLSNPSTSTTLPFPSLLPMPSQHFEKKKTNGVHRFEYVGRSRFRELEKRVENGDFLDIGGDGGGSGVWGCYSAAGGVGGEV